MYEVSIITGNVMSAGTDANVFINLFGEKGDTGKRWLKKSKTSEQPFEKGNVSFCLFDKPGDPKRCTIKPCI